MPLIMFEMSKDFIVNMFRRIFIVIDTIIYRMISLFMQVIFDISNFTLNASLFDKIVDKVYLILSIFMLFKLTISLLSYLANPEKINDKEKGAGKVVTRTILVLTMLLILPSGFELLGRVQNALLPTIPRIILGKSVSSSNTSDITNQVGKEGESIAWEMLSAFVYLSDVCPDMEKNTPILEYLENHKDELEGKITYDRLFQGTQAAINAGCKDKETSYQLDYSPIISTVCGGFVIYVLIGIAISVAVRLFKLIILQVIAPIPIISYIDPKSSKDGAFNTWVKSIVSTWLELFIQLGILYLIVFIINELLLGTLGNFGNYAVNLPFIRSLFFIVFIVLGLFMFAKQAPKFIIDSLGIKSKGTFAKALGLAGTALGLGGAVATGIRSSWAADTANGHNHKNPFNLLKNVGSGLLGGLATTGAAGAAVMSAEKEPLKAGIDVLNKRNAQAMSYGTSGSTAFGRATTGMQNLLFGANTLDADNKQISAYENANKLILAYKQDTEKKALEQIGDGKKGIRVDITDASGTVHTGLNYREFVNYTEGAKNGDVDSIKWFTDHGFTNWQEAQSILDDLKDKQTEVHMDRVVNGYTYDGKFISGQEYDGTAANDLVLAKDAIQGLNLDGLNINWSNLVGKNKDGIKMALGKTNEKVTQIKTSARYKKRANSTNNK